MDSWTFFIFALTSLFTIINPFSAATMFVSITEGDSRKKLLWMSRRAAFTSVIVLLVFAFGGNYILKFFSISIDAFRIAGGILICRVGLGMLNNKPRHLKSEEAKREAYEKEDISIVPLAIPMLSGPGSITTAIVLMNESVGASQVFILVGVILLLGVLSFVILSKAHSIAGFLGTNGKNVLERILGLLVLVVGVQFFINGTKGILMSWGFIV